MKLTVSRKMRTATMCLVGLAFALAFTAQSARAQSAAFTQSMDVGSQGAQVSTLQTFLATKTSHYPEGLVTGYFGSLTQAAVQRFQCAEEIVCSGDPSTTGYGRVGPKTLVQLNLRANGSVGIDASAPFVSGISVATFSSTATITYATNELASGKIYYASSPLILSEAAGIGFAPIIGGTGVMADTNLRNSHSIAISGLASSTTYHYVIQAVDANGNLSVTWPSTFRTAP